MFSSKQYKRAIAYLESFIDYEQKNKYAYKKVFKLSAVKRLYDYLGIEYTKLNVLHIAGTKGKGSTAYFCAYLLARLGYKVGLYTSPHFFNWRERIKILELSDKACVKERMISPYAISQISQDFRKALAKAKHKYQPSFFEIFTAVALRYFWQEKVDFAVLETGLGGRLDATNVVKPKITIITHVGYDHTDKLGKRLGEIAYEKAGIIKFRTPLVLALSKKAALKVILQRAAELKAPVFLAQRDFLTEKITIKPQAIAFKLNSCMIQLNLKLRLRGLCQIENAALALLAVNSLDKKVKQIKYWNNLNLPGRFETIKQKPLVLIDVAHNVSSFKELNRNLKTYYPQKKIILIFAASSDKDVCAMLKNISFNQLIITTFPGPRAAAPEAIQQKAKVALATLTNDVKAAYNAALNHYDKNSLIVISGSFFLAAQAKKILTNYEQ